MSIPPPPSNIIAGSEDFGQKRPAQFIDSTAKKKSAFESPIRQPTLEQRRTKFTSFGRRSSTYWYVKTPYSVVKV